MSTSISARSGYRAAFIAALVLTAAAWVRADGPFQPAWESLAKHEAPEWLLDAKFGIYAHWGVYSVPAYQTEWYGKRMYDKGEGKGKGGQNSVYRHHVQTYGDPSKFGYKDFVPMFKAEKYDPEEWAKLIESCGAKYAGFAVVHHDGFLLWDSKINRWNAGNMGPKRDLYGDFVSALRKHGLKTIATEHHLRTFNWYLPGSDGFGVLKDLDKTAKIVKDAGYDLADPKFADLYWNEVAGRRYPDFMAEWQAEVREVIDKYQPDLLWFDGGDFRGKDSEKVVLDLLAHYQNSGRAWGKPVEVLNKLAGNGQWNFPENYAVLTFEEGRDRPAKFDRPWIDDMRIGDKAWCYVEGQQYKPAGEIIAGLVDRVARGGGLLLNLSPKADGTFPDAEKAVLQEIGQWLKVNREAIYGTRPWTVQSEGNEKKLIEANGRKWTFRRCDASDIRFTRPKDDSCVYVFCLGVPKQDVRVLSLGRNAGHARKPIANVSLLGSGAKVQWTQEADALVIKPPASVPTPQAVTFKITF